MSTRPGPPKRRKREEKRKDAAAAASTTLKVVGLGLERLEKPDHPMKSVDLAGNALTTAAVLKSLPTELHAGFLQWLSVKDNQLSSLHGFAEAWPLLRVLNVSGNQLTHVSGHRPWQNTLQALVASDNKITHVAHLGKLHQLNTLVLAGNLLTRLPEDLSQLKQLRKLNLSRNQLAEFPPIAGLPDLVELRLAKNNIQRITPAHVEGCPSLAIVELGSNDVEDWESIASLAASPITSLNILENPRLPLEDHVGKLTQLFSGIEIIDSRRVAARTAKRTAKRTAPDTDLQAAAPAMAAAGSKKVGEKRQPPQQPRVTVTANEDEVDEFDLAAANLSGVVTVREGPPIPSLKVIPASAPGSEAVSPARAPEVDPQLQPTAAAAAAAAFGAARGIGIGGESAWD